MNPDRDLRRQELLDQLKAERISLQRAHWLEKIYLPLEGPINQSMTLQRQSKEIVELANKYIALFKDLND